MGVLVKVPPFAEEKPGTIPFTGRNAIFFSLLRRSVDGVITDIPLIFGGVRPRKKGPRSACPFPEGSSGKSARNFCVRGP